MLKKFLSNKLPGFYVSLIGFVFGLLTLIIYTARGGNYLSPVSISVVIILVIGLLSHAFSLAMDFKILGILPVIFYAVSLAILLNTEMLFITNVGFGVDGNTFDAAFFLFLIFDVLALLASAVGFSMGLSKNGRLLSKE